MQLIALEANKVDKSLLHDSHVVDRSFYYAEHREECPNFENHAHGPDGYFDWAEWSSWMSATHTQKRCPGCGLFVLWVPKGELIMSGKDEHWQMAEDCEARESRMSDWERNFIDSIKTRLGEGKSLTPNQEEILNELWDKVTERG